MVIGGEVPPELAEEAQKIFVGQTFKDTGDVIEASSGLLESILSLDVESVGKYRTRVL